MSISEATRARKIAARYTVDQETRCWIWTGAMRKGGYGCLTIDSVVIAAHRYFYERYKGPIPDGLEIDHLCRTPACVNPDHMEAVTKLENMRRVGRVVEGRVMWALRHSPMSPTDIGLLLGHTYDRAAAAACQILKRLVERGKVVREKHAGGRRVIYRRA